MNFDELTYFLEKRLKMEMPGQMAHELMKPKLPNGQVLRIKHTSAPKESAVLVLLFESEGQIRFPLIQRTRYEGIHSGQMALPGGRREKSDNDLFETVLRETNEEIGVRKDDVEILGHLSEFYVVASNHNVLPVIGKIQVKPKFIPDSREVEEVVTPTLQHLLDPSKKKEKEIIVSNGVKLHCPYFDLEGRTVWGATAMILSELVVAMKDFNPK